MFSAVTNIPHPDLAISPISTGERVIDADGELVIPVADERQTEPPRQRSPAWTRDELILALDLYLHSRPQLPGKESPEVVALSEELNELARIIHGAALKCW
jgi:hypothetical protein